jgi:hypothetical protein
MVFNLSEPGHQGIAIGQVNEQEIGRADRIQQNASIDD